MTGLQSFASITSHLQIRRPFSSSLLGLPISCTKSHNVWSNTGRKGIFEIVRGMLKFPDSLELGYCFYFVTSILSFKNRSLYISGPEDRYWLWYYVNRTIGRSTRVWSWITRPCVSLSQEAWGGNWNGIRFQSHLKWKILRRVYLLYYAWLNCRSDSKRQVIISMYRSNYLVPFHSPKFVNGQLFPLSGTMLKVSLQSQKENTSRISFWFLPLVTIKRKSYSSEFLW